MLNKADLCPDPAARVAEVNALARETPVVVTSAVSEEGIRPILPLIGPGKRGNVDGFTPGVFVGAYPGLGYFDSLGVQADGAVCVATILAGGITTFWPGTSRVKHTPLPDPLVTNICWGGKTMKTAYITLSGTGKLIAMDWPKPGLRLNYNA